MKQTALDWYWDKIKSHFEHDGDLLETATFTFAIAKQKEREQIEEAHIAGMEFIAVDPKHYVDDANDYYNSEYKGGEQ